MGIDRILKNSKWLGQSGVLLLLTFGAIFGNLFGIQLFSGMYFWFGSIATLIVVSLYGSLWGVLVAFVSSWLVLSAGDQGLIAFIYVGEAFLVGQFLRHFKENLLIADGLFWCIVGMPLVWLINRVVLNIDFDSTMFLTLKSGVDGLFSALVANLIITYLPLRKWAKLEDQNEEAKYITMEQMLFNLLVMLILLPIFVFTLSDIRSEQLKIEHSIVTKLQAAGPMVESRLSRINSKNAQNLTAVEFVKRVKLKDKIAIVVTDSSGRLLATSSPGILPMKALEKGRVTQLKGNISLWIPMGRSQMFHGQEWSRALYYNKINVSGNRPWQVEITTTASDYYTDFQVAAISDLTKVLILTFLAIFCAKIVAKKLSGPLEHLNRTTTDLPERLRDGQVIEWPGSKIREIHLLVNNYRLMTQTLKDDFLEIKAARAIAEEAKSKSDATIACIGDGLGIVNSQMEIVYQNQSMKDLLGEYQYQKCYEVYAGRKEPCRNCPVVMALADGEVHLGEMVTSREKGRKHIEVTASCLRDANGDIMGVVEIVRDISERRQNELALQDQRSRLEIQLKHSEAIAHLAEIVILSEDRHIILDSMCKTVGQTLGLDRALIFQNDQKNDKIQLIAEWINPRVMESLPNPLYFDPSHPIHFTVDDLEQGVVESHEDTISPVLSPETGRKLHEEMGIRSLLWYPFAQYQIGNYVLAINQLRYRREWLEEEIAFLGVISKQVEMALQKIQYLKELQKSSDLVLMQSAAMNATRDGMALIGPEGNLVYVNSALAELYGYQPEEALSKTWRELFSPRDVTSFPQDILPEIQKHGHWHGEITGQKKDGTLFSMELTMDNVDGVGMVWVLRNITERKQMMSQLMHQAHHDALTELPNRVLFQERLELEIKHAKREKQRLAVLFLDLDRFKLVNDMLGHAIGDELLKEVTQRLISCVRESDTIARMGGDEFTLLLPAIASGQAVSFVAEKILLALQKPWNFGNQEFQVTTSVGIAIFPEDGDDIETLIKHADIAMYRAKEVGRNNYVIYDESMDSDIRERMLLENNLRHALEREELIIYYQPQVNTSTEKIIGVEALLRWKPEGQDMIMPGQFIPVAEETGLIIPIGEWVIRTACRQNKAWQNAGYPPFMVTVNLSAKQFMQKNLVESIVAILQETGLEPKWLELEITESIAMQEVEFTIETLRRLSDMGVKLAIDDFGTGYSSLNYIKRFPIHTLKIDRSFVGEIPGNSSNAAVVSTIIVLAQNLNLKVIGEGVETVEQCEFLQARNCMNMQGFLFARPVPVTELEALLKVSDVSISTV